MATSISDMEDLPPVLEWKYHHVSDWLIHKGFRQYSDLLAIHHRLDGEALILITEEDLRSPPLELKVLGDIKRLSKCIKELKETAFGNGRQKRIQSRLGTDASKSRLSSYSGDEEDAFINNSQSRIQKIDSDATPFFLSENKRTLLSFLYSTVVFMVTSFVMTVVHDRVPDIKTHPPLPDVVLDNIPLMPWAFEWCEICALLLTVMWLGVLFFHKHRLVLFRRMCALFGTVFLLRCFTMYVTSMSVPGIHLGCSAKVYGDFQTKVKRAFEIFSGGGMSLSGVRSCGDYMFSGHTSTCTLLNFFVTEYIPRRWQLMHSFCWLLNAFAVFFILAAHEHYTIDVVIAFYISSRLFLYYHTLVGASFATERDRRRAKTWFPLFWLFEHDSVGKVPNEYEWPFSGWYQSQIKKKNN